MIVHNVAQGGEEWRRARAGVITASMIHVIMAKTGGLTDQQATYVSAIKGGASQEQALLAAGYKKAPSAAAVEVALAGGAPGDWSDAAKNYAFKLAIERLSGGPLGDDEFNPWQAARGSALEANARIVHESWIGDIVEECGFIATDDGLFGASVDGLIGEDEGAEYKCFLATSKLRPILLDNDVSSVVDQCQFAMAITNRKCWHFGLYLPDLEKIGKRFTLIKIERDDNYIDRIWDEAIKFNSLVEAYMAQLRGGPAVPAVPEAASPPADPPVAATEEGSSPPEEPVEVGPLETAIKAASTMAAQAIPEDTIKLGDINARMKGLSVNAEFMTKVIGIKPLDIKGRAVVFASSQWPDIKAGIIKFVESL